MNNRFINNQIRGFALASAINGKFVAAEVAASSLQPLASTVDNTIENFTTRSLGAIDYFK